MRFCRTTIWAPGLLLALIGCGGGAGDAGPGSAALFSGAYEMVGFSGVAGVPDEATAFWGTAVGDGAGMTTAAGMITENRNGVVTGPDADTPTAYTLTADRRITFEFGGTPLHTGGISADGTVVCFGSVLGGSAPAIGILGKKSGVFSDASLSGLYHLCAFAYNATPEDEAVFGTVTFDGLGGAASNTTSNVAGVVSPPVAGINTYAVGPDGAMSMSLFGELLRGQILAGGELITLSGATAAGFPVIAVLVQGSMGAANAQLSGTYHSIAMTADPGAGDVWLSTTGTFSSDGGGAFSVGAFTTNADSVTTSFPPFPGSLPYVVNPSGRLTWGNYVGGVSPSGNFATFAGSTSRPGSPEMWFLLR